MDGMGGWSQPAMTRRPYYSGEHRPPSTTSPWRKLALLLFVVPIALVPMGLVVWNKLHARLDELYKENSSLLSQLQVLNKHSDAVEEDIATLFGHARRLSATREENEGPDSARSSRSSAQESAAGEGEHRRNLLATEAAVGTGGEFETLISPVSVISTNITATDTIKARKVIADIVMSGSSILAASSSTSGSGGGTSTLFKAGLDA